MSCNDSWRLDEHDMRRLGHGVHHATGPTAYAYAGLVPCGLAVWVCYMRSRGAVGIPR